MNFRTKMLGTAAAVMSPETGSGSEAVGFKHDPAILNVMNEIRDAVSEADYDKMREAYKVAYGKDTSLNNEAVLYVMAASDDDKAPADWAADMLAHEQALSGDDDDDDDTDGEVTSISATNADAFTLGVVDKLSADTAFTLMLHGMVVKKEQADTGALPIMIEAAKALGDDVMRELPFPGTTSEDTKGTNRRPDITRPKVTADGKRKKIRISVIDNIADLMPEATEYTARLDAVKKKKTDKRIGPSEYQDELGFCRRRLNSNRGYVRNAIACWKILDGINQMPNLEAYYKTEQMLASKAAEAGRAIVPNDPAETVPDGYVTVLKQGSEPFVVQSTLAKERDNVRHLTVAQFKTLRPDDAIANGGGFDHLIDTMSRQSGGADGEGDAIEDFKGFEASSLSYVTYLNGSGYDDAKLWLKRNPKTRAAMLDTLQTISDNLEGLLSEYGEELKVIAAKKKTGQNKGAPAQPANAVA